jgi:hypothetical protein
MDNRKIINRRIINPRGVVNPRGLSPRGIVNPRMIGPVSRTGNQRGPGMVAFDKEFYGGPAPLNINDVPADLRESRNKYSGVTVEEYGNLQGNGLGALVPYDSTIAKSLQNIDAVTSAYVVRRGLIGRIVNIPLGTTPTLVIHTDEPRGYLLYNGNLGGNTQDFGLIPTVLNAGAVTLVGATTLTSPLIDTVDYQTGRFWATVTFPGGAGPVTIELQTLSPTGSVATSSTLFTLTVAGTFYKYVGEVGIDEVAQVLVTVPGGTTITLEVTMELKGGVIGNNLPVNNNIFLGSAGVNFITGYPIAPGREKPFYFVENLDLYGVLKDDAIDPLILNVFEL